jgi:hypothetical protein
VLSPGQQPQHADGVPYVLGFAENLTADEDDRVGRQNDGVRMGLKARICLLARQPADVFARRFELPHGFVYVYWKHLKRNTRRAQ